MTDTTQPAVDAAELERDLALLAAREGVGVLELLRGLVDKEDPSPREDVDCELLRRAQARLPFTAPSSELLALTKRLEPEVEKATEAVSDAFGEIQGELSEIDSDVRANAVTLHSPESLEPRFRLTSAPVPGRVLDREPCFELLRTNAKGRSVVTCRVFVSDILELVLRAKKDEPLGFISELPRGAR